MAWFPCNIHCEMINWDICLQNSNYCNYFHGEIQECKDLGDTALNTFLTSFFMLSLHALILPDYILTFIYALILSTLSHALTSQRNCLCSNLFFKHLLGIPVPITPLKPQSYILLIAKFRGTLFSLCLILSLSRIQCGWLLPALKKIHSSWHTVLTFLLSTLLILFSYFLFFIFGGFYSSTIG